MSGESERREWAERRIILTKYFSHLAPLGAGDLRCALVRRHALLLLSNLLLQDYVKWRGLLVHRYLAATCDKDESVSQLAEMTLCGPLLSKQPLLFSNSFVESLFVFNNSTNHPIFKNAASSGDNGSGAVGFDCGMLEGDRRKGRRMKIYKMMLNQMSDEMKIGIVARLAKEVLGGALLGGSLFGGTKRADDNEASVGIIGRESVVENAASSSVLGDCFSILLCQESRVKSGKDVLEEKEDESEELMGVNGGVVNAQLEAAKGKLLTKISRKHLIESVVPNLVELKNVFEKHKSPLLKSLMRYLREIFRMYNHEVKECLASDPVLLSELTYDMKKFNEALKREKMLLEEQEELERAREEEGGGGGGGGGLFDEDEEEEQQENVVEGGGGGGGESVEVAAPVLKSRRGGGGREQGASSKTCEISQIDKE